MYAIGQNKQGVHFLLVIIKLRQCFLSYIVTYGVDIILLDLVVVITFFALSTILIVLYGYFFLKIKLRLIIG